MQKWVKNCICFPGEKLCCYANNTSGGVYLLFLFFLLSLGGITYYFPGEISWISCSILLWLCLGISLLNHSLHSDKKISSKALSVKNRLLI